ncbi:MAG TPA: GNAT family N-acetyltransferase [Gaiellaceae bacterium]
MTRLNAPTELNTERLLLRQWKASDLEPFAELNADPETMRYFPAPLTRAESDALVDRASAQIHERGWGIWAVEVRSTGDFIGFVGLDVPRFEAHFTPAVEIGWRLLRADWGHGYATEAARASLAFGFDELRLDEIVAMTVVANDRSRRVMERLGMTHDPGDDFEHPLLEEASPLRRHVLYRLASSDWSSAPPARTANSPASPP